jgi:hypothetical protein
MSLYLFLVLSPSVYVITGLSTFDGGAGSNSYLYTRNTSSGVAIDFSIAFFFRKYISLLFFQQDGRIKNF